MIRPAMDPVNCRLVRLRTTRPLGSDNVLNAQLIRDLSWLAENKVIGGSVIRFIVPDLGIDRPADVIAIEPCPPIKPGRGRVVTAKFTTSQCRVLLVKVSARISR